MTLIKLSIIIMGIIFISPLSAQDAAPSPVEDKRPILPINESKEAKAARPKLQAILKQL